MSESLYSIALARAARHDLSGALALEHVLDTHAAELITLLKAEIGSIPSDVAQLIRAHKYSDALRLANRVEHTVQILNLRGCLYARRRQYRKAANCFAPLASV